MASIKTIHPHTPTLCVQSYKFGETRLTLGFSDSRPALQREKEMDIGGRWEGLATLVSTSSSLSDTLQNERSPVTDGEAAWGKRWAWGQ